MDDEELTPLDPRYRTLLGVVALIASVPFIIAALIVENLRVAPTGIFIGPVVIIAAVIIMRLPLRRYAARGFAMVEERLRVVRGIWWRSDSVVPFGRVQHIDVNRGPLERYFGLATLTVHTAGTHGASVHLPGLAYADALAMRDAIRAHIKRETL